MSTHSSRPLPEDEQEFLRFAREGIAGAFLSCVRAGSTKESITRFQTIDHPILGGKPKGVNRSAMVEFEATLVAPVFGMKEVFIHTGICGYPVGMFLQRDDNLFSFHQSDSPWLAPADADYRRPYLQRPTPEPSMFEEHVDYEHLPTLESLVTEQGLRYWAVTYQRTPKSLPDWVMLGRPVLGQRRFGYARDIAVALGQMDLDLTIDMNPGMPPTPPFNISPADKGQGDE